MEIEFLIKVGYYLGVSPFRFCHRGNTIEVKATSMWKVACGILHVATIFLTPLLTVYPSMKAGLKSGKPQVLFDIALLSTGQCLLYSVLYILWYRREELWEIVKELEPCVQHHKGKNCSRVGKCLLIAGTIFLPLGLWMYPHDSGMDSAVKEIWGCNVPLNDNSTRIPFLPWIHLLSHDYRGDGCNYPGFVRASIIVQFVFYFYSSLQFGFATSVMLAFSMSLYRTTIQLHNLTMVSARAKSMTSLVNGYNKAKCRIGMVNKLLSISPLLLTVEIVMHISLSVPWTLTRFDLLSVVELCMALLVLGSFMLAAEGNRLMEEIENFIIQGCPHHDASNTAITLATSLGDCGLKGWNFFTFSYSFLGSVGSAIFTYILVVVQMK